MEKGERRLNIAVITSLDPRSRMSWSGTIYYLSQALQKHCGEVTYIGPMDAPFEMFIGKIRHRSTQLLLKKNFMYYHGHLVAKRYAQIASRRLMEHPIDLIVAPTGAPEIAFLHTKLPIVLVEDATFALLHDYYPMFSNLIDASFQELNTIEDLALKKARMIIMSSGWAAQSAITEYHVDAAKVHVLPFGANLDRIPSRDLVLNRKRSASCKLLFIGAYWERKGGDIAIETFLKLREMGIRAELTICGCVPPDGFSHEGFVCIPFLDKNDECQRKELEHLYMCADFLLLPTRNDCTPVVFSEAAAFGLPVFTANTGGIAEVVREGETGFLLPYEARGQAYAEAIASVYQDESRYETLVRSSRAFFEERLNWDVWGRVLKKLINELVVQPETQSSSKERVEV